MIGIVDYNSGNLRSVSNALDRIGADWFISGSIDELDRADGIILPGVWAARSAMKALEASGLREWITKLERPFLGICLGMQILFEHSDEDDTECLGIIPGNIVRFDETKGKVPHMGWNSLRPVVDDPIMRGLSGEEFFYFVHGYHAPRGEADIGVTEYSVEFASVVRYRNFYGVQFHPEKSGDAGLKLLLNFIPSVSVAALADTSPFVKGRDDKGGD